MDETSSDTSDDNEDLEFFLLCGELLFSERQDRVFRARLHWDSHVEMLRREGMYERTYRMSEVSFAKLIDLIRPAISVDHGMSFVSTAGTTLPIIPEIFLHCFLRYLCGGSHIDIRLVAQVSTSSFYRCVHACINAIFNCREMHFSFEAEPDVLSNRMKCFEALSSHRIFRGCVGCIAGVLIEIKRPSSAEVPNSRDYFSGHYQMYGLNVQAVCDHSYRFLWLGVLGPGGSSDIMCYRQGDISQLVAELPAGAYVLGDNAYPVSEHLLTPFSGSNKENIWNDSYNFHLSQLRIKIEQTFGIFVNRFGLFKNQLQLSLKNVPSLILAAAKVHNFIMNERFPDADEVSPSIEDICSILPDEGGISHIPSMPEDTNEVVHGHSTLRQMIVDHIRSNGYTRPSYNINRNSMQ